MSEENTNSQENDITETNPIEEQAMERGWRPKEEWEGDPDQWVDAKTFVEKGELMDTIHAANQSNKQLRSELEAIKGSMQEVREHYEKWAKSEIDNKIKELKSARREAMRVDDYDAADELEDQIDQIKEEERKLKERASKEEDTSAPQIPQEVQTWIQNNPWVDENSTEFQPDLAQEAMLLLQAEVNRTGDRSVASMNRVKQKMEKLYPERFGGRTRASTSVDSSDTSTRGGNSNKGAGLVRQMSDLQRKVGETFVKSGAVKSLAEYAKQLKDMGEL